MSNLHDKLLSKLKKQTSTCLVEHQMLQAHDHIMVGLSGGKDSWMLLYLLAQLKKNMPFPIKISAVTIDGGLIGLDTTTLDAQTKKLDVPFYLERQRIFEIVSEKKDEGSTFCSMCAKLRRGAIYTMAKKIGATKIALGHHLDDAIETLFLNMFYSGRMAALPPVLHSDSGYVPIIRPLLYSTEHDLTQGFKAISYKSVGCACPICPIHPEFDGHDDLKRMAMKKHIRAMAADNPSFYDSARTALKSVELSRFFDVRHMDRGHVPIFLNR
ncbi:MAG: hypothetical protein KDD48_06395 [Bdellovibrionales bacterium]|nr:hypothetical protein [Bdellovibrionales bacterium]